MRMKGELTGKSVDCIGSFSDTQTKMAKACDAFGVELSKLEVV
jgi:hypothetical protein